LARTQLTDDGNEIKRMSVYIVIWSTFDLGKQETLLQPFAGESFVDSDTPTY